MYEFVTGGGGYEFDGSPSQLDPLAAEGSAMVRSLVADFCCAEGIAVDVLRDRRFRGLELSAAIVHEVGSASDEHDAIRSLAAVADWSIVIAPEFCGYLYTRCRLVEESGGRLLGPGAALVAILSDKHATAEHLRARGVNAPLGTILDRGRLPADFSYPAVLKPCDGAGSQGVRLIEAPSDLNGWHWRAASAADREAQHWRDASATRGAETWRLETFCPGTPASVACLCGPGRILPLVPCLQRLSQDGRFAYLGGSLPIDPALATRATILAVRAVETFAQPFGYMGVDLVLGKDVSGSDDVVVEVNPRLTTSYIGYRALADQNLAAAMLAIACGDDFELAWQDGHVRFDPREMVKREVSTGNL